MSNTLDSNLPDRDATCSHASDEELGSSSNHLTLDVEIIIDESVDAFATCQMMTKAVRTSAAFRGYHCGSVGIRVTDDTTIRDLNRVYLGHDDATDVISFAYEAKGNVLSGELVVSADTAKSMATNDWSAAAEVLLYVVHGTLHITGMDDHDEVHRAEMRRAEQTIMTDLGFSNIQQYGADQVISARELPTENEWLVEDAGPKSSC